MSETQPATLPSTYGLALLVIATAQLMVVLDATVTNVALVTLLVTIAMTRIRGAATGSRTPGRARTVHPTGL